MNHTLIVLGWLTLVVAIGSYFLFRDTMNRIQYVEHLRIYWITRDTATDETPRVMRAFMKQTAKPYWYGHGVQFKFRRWTFQVGVLDGKAPSLDKQLGKGWLEEVDTEDIRLKDGNYKEVTDVQEEA